MRRPRAHSRLLQLLLSSGAIVSFSSVLIAVGGLLLLAPRPLVELTDCRGQSLQRVILHDICFIFANQASSFVDWRLTVSAVEILEQQPASACMLVIIADRRRMSSVMIFGHSLVGPVRHLHVLLTCHLTLVNVKQSDIN